MKLFVRLLRASLLVWLVFSSYALQFGLERLLHANTTPAARADSAQATGAPAWARRRRERVHERNAERLRRGMLSLRGVYIKLGQVLSVMVGLLPAVYRERLEALQDRVPPRPFAEMERAFERSLGKRPSECLRAIDPRPVAAASLGQVHLGELHDGTAVAVKLLYPDIRAVIAVDLRVLRFAMRLLSRIVPLRDLESVHAALVDLLARETDYLHEAACMKRMAAHFAGRKDVLVPQVIDALTSRDVLTMTRMQGVKVSDVTELRAQGIDPQAVGKLLLSCFLEQLLVHRDFQADPHPGNFLVQKGDERAPLRLVILDFGAVCEAPEGLVDGLIDALVAFFARDGQRLLAALERMGFVAAEADRELAHRTVLMYFDRLLRVHSHSPQALLDRKPGQLRRLLDPQLDLSELRALARAFNVPDGWFYVERALVLMFGLVGSVAPELDLVKVAYPHLMPLLAARTQAARSQSAE
jgi:predicted unusual protein kinase regulating ubiquinone biosynthesis (AarF/ABC1/UbiB family)